MSGERSDDPGSKTLRKKHPLAVRWFHWLNFPLLFVMIWSGALIYWANDIYGVRVGGREIVKILPERVGGVDPYAPRAPSWAPKFLTTPEDESVPNSARDWYMLSQRLPDGMAWHFFFMWFFTLNGIAYVLFTAISGQWRFLVPQRGTVRHAWWTILHDLHLRKEPPPPQKFNGSQQIAYTMIILMGLGSVLTGLAIYKPSQLSWLTFLFGGYMAARFIHFWLMMGYLGFFVIHIAQVIKTGWNNFRAMVTGYEIA